MSLVLPVIDDLNRPFWEGCRAGALRLQRCARCGQLRYPVAAVCPQLPVDRGDLGGDERARRDLHLRGLPPRLQRGAGATACPTASRSSRLEEGPIVIGNVTGAEPEALRVGLPVRVVFEPVSEEIARPCFEPDGQGER